MARGDAVKDEKARRRFLNREHKATHAVMLDGTEYAFAVHGFRCVKYLRTTGKYVYVVDTETQVTRKIEIDVWKKLERKAWLLDEKGKKINV